MRTIKNGENWKMVKIETICGKEGWAGAKKTRLLDYFVLFLINPLDYRTIISMEGVEP